MNFLKSLKKTKRQKKIGSFQIEQLFFVFIENIILCLDKIEAQAKKILRRIGKEILIDD